MAFPAETALALLSQSHVQGRLGHAYLITGPGGSGKQGVAEQLAALIHGGSGEPFAHSDVHLVEPESKSRRIVIAQIRELERELHMRSSVGAKKIGVIIDADRLIEAAANAFLKTLEEPPDNSLLLLLTALPEVLPETIASRCIEVPLQLVTKRACSACETRLLQALQTYSQNPRGELPQVFGLVREFLDALGEARAAITDQSEAAFKAEEKLYKQTTDGKWLDEREDYYKASNEARYIEERARLVELLEQWWADVLRQKHGGASLDHPEFSTETAALADRLSTPQVLRKTAALEELRDHLGRNIQEQLCVEVSFLKTFGSEGERQRTVS